MQLRNAQVSNQIPSNQLSGSNPINILSWEPNVNSPDRFDGNRNNTEIFWQQLSTIFQLQPSRFVNEDHKILYVTSFMKGSALEWVMPKLRKNEFALLNYHNFEDLIRDTFGSMENKHAK